MNNLAGYALLITLSFGGASTYAQTNMNGNVVMNDAQKKINLSETNARQAILKMAGEYEVDFRFEEIYAAKEGYELKPDELSKADETVIVLENSPNKISLQHLLVARGHVVKHWRQDWEYEPKKMWKYIGNYQWKKVELSEQESKGKWLQTVWQVDDSPRYAGLGHWTSDHGIESWTSEDTLRPLPRRELTTRDDYDTLIGVNRQAISANGWVHEQTNIKYDSKTNQPIARELGVNTYVKVKGADFKPAYEYWEKNKNYWSQVRTTWDQALAQNEVVGLKFTRQKDDDKQAHYVHFMNQAKEFLNQPVNNKMQKDVNNLMNEQLTVGQVK